MTPQEEATQIFNDVVRELSSPSYDLKLAMRRCLHACTLINWSAGQEWFDRELNGYRDGVPTPQHRIGYGYYRWNIQFGSSTKLARAVVGDLLFEEAGDEHPETTTEGEFRGDIDGLLNGRSGGIVQTTGRVLSKYKAGIGNYRLEEVRVFPAHTYHTIVKAIEGYTFNFASQSYRTLRYGNALTDIWAAYRVKVDAALGQLGMNNHLDAIESGLRSDNPESWRNVVYGCRNVLDDLANYLWRDNRPTYVHLPARKGGSMDVSQGRTLNRLQAYLHHKGVTGSQGDFLRDEAERLDASLRSLYGVVNSAHGAMTLDRARTAALPTYFLIGELAQRTDLLPIDKYGPLATPGPS